MSSRAPFIATMALVLAVALLASSCGGSERPGAFPPPETDAAPSPTPAPAPAPTDSFTDGRYYGYIADIDTAASPSTLEIDLAEFLTGAEATRAAVEDDAIPPGESVPNDYYVRNPERDLLTLPVSEDVTVTAVRCPGPCEDGVPGDFEALADSFDDPEPKDLTDDYRGASSQYWITVDAGVVVAIDEQYLP